MATAVIPQAVAVVSPGKDERTQLLIQAAYDLLDEGGLEDLTIRAVLQRSGLARRAFYEQFDGKDGLVLAVFEENLRFAAKHFRSEAVEAGEPVEALRRIVIGLVLGQLGFGASSGRRSAALSREHLRLAQLHPHRLQLTLSPLLELIAEQIAQGVAAGKLRECDPAVQASLVYNFVAATVHVELLAQEGGEPDRQRRIALADTIWEFCRRAIIA